VKLCLSYFKHVFTTQEGIECINLRIPLFHKEQKILEFGVKFFLGKKLFWCSCGEKYDSLGLGGGMLTYTPLQSQLLEEVKENEKDYDQKSTKKRKKYFTQKR